MYAIIGSTDIGYQIVAFFHVLLAIAAFGPTFGFMIASKRAQTVRGEAGYQIGESVVDTSSKLVRPGSWIVGILGFGLVSMSDTFEFSDTWVIVSIVLFAVGILNAELNITPTFKKMQAIQAELLAMPAGEAPAGPPPHVAQFESLGKRMAMAGGIGHLVIVALVWVMIVKPG